MMISDWPWAASDFHEVPEGYEPLRLGSTIVGWTPSLSVQEKKEAHSVKAVMGDKTYNIELPALWIARDALGLTGDKAFETQLRFEVDIILNMPLGSLSRTSGGHLLNYNDHTATTLHSALSNFVRLREAYIQSKLHEQTKPEVMETLLFLVTNKYPLKAMKELSWRGGKLSNLLKDSHMVYMQEGHSFFSIKNNMNAFKEFIYLQALGYDERAKNAERVYSWQVSRKYKPENVFLLKAEANSEEEQALGEMLFDEAYLNAFLDETGQQTEPSGSRKLFLFARADDTLADWVMGTTIYVSDMYQTLSAKGVF